MVRIQLILITLLLSCCSKEIIPDSSIYDCEIIWENNNENHPKDFEFQNFLEDMNNRGLPGIMMTIKTPDGNIWSGASGKIDLASDTDLKPCNISRIGSITKTFTAVLVLDQVDKGIINLDDSINKYLDVTITSKIDQSHHITIRNLLNHSSGLRDYTTISGFTEFINEPKRIFTTQEYLELNVFDRELLFTPGTSFSYSNANYGLLGWILEEITGQKLQKLYEEVITKPLGLHHTSYSKETPTPSHLMRGYADFNDDGKIFDTSDWGVLIISPAAGILSNTYDLLIFQEALHGGQLLSAQSYQEMITFINVVDPKFDRTEYGLGLRKWETEFGEAYGHSGGMYGYLGEAFYFPESGVTYTLLVNCSFGICNQIVDEQLNQEILELIFQ